jgi:UDP-N-acetylglucosamine 4,6-dehydratase/5-epimerase
MRIAITGGSGTLGRALITRLAQDGADRIVTFSRDESKRASLANEFSWHHGFRVYAGDVRDADRLRDIFKGCEVVVHAAARKVVTAHPDEPEEMLKTNVLGTKHVIEAAKLAGVGKVLFISSDKAVRAENVYGVSKALAEHLIVNANARCLPQGLRLGVLRYGNVLGSTGSVVQLWQAQRQAGKAVTVSHVGMTRFWLTIEQAVDYVLQALANLRGGEIFVPHVPAAPLRLLIEALDIPLTEVVVSGVRQGGEKLHEELLSAAEARRTVRRPGSELYVVPPFQHPEMWDLQPWMGEPVGEDFTYCSENWPWQLSVTAMQRLLADVAISFSRP